MTLGTFSSDDYLSEFPAILSEVESQKSCISEVASFICSDRERIIVCTGIGKSLIMAERLAASLRSIGFRAFSLNGAEIAHGDLGAIREFETFLIIFSNSGETAEMLELLQRVDAVQNRVLTITGKINSTLASSGTWRFIANRGYLRDYGNFLPTLSLTEASIFCDLLIIELCNILPISPRDFLKNHYSGNLGLNLGKTILDVMISRERCALVESDERLERVAEILTQNGSGLAIVEKFEEGVGKLVGVISDGDIRRFIVTGEISKHKRAGEVCIQDPLTISAKATIAEALTMMTANKKKVISAIPVVDSGAVIGLITMKDIVKYRNIMEKI